MRIVTTDFVQNAAILETKEAIFTEQVSSVNVAKDAINWLKGVLGGKSDAYSQEYANVRKEAIADLENQAARMGGNGIINLQINYDQFLNSDIMLIVVTACGTVVRLKETEGGHLPPVAENPAIEGQG